MNPDTSRTPTSSATVTAASAVVIDAGGPLDPVFDAAERLSVAPSMVLLTHHHHDHVSEVPGAHRALAGRRRS